MITLNYPKNGWETIEEELRKDKKLVWKYNKPGIYCIKVNGNIVYIGKSLNMLTRIAQHMFEINRVNQKSHKYQVLRQIKDMGINIQFDVLKKCYGSTTDELYSALGDAEAWYIRENMPLLNYQIPHIGDYYNFEVNRVAQNVTAAEVIERSKHAITF